MVRKEEEQKSLAEEVIVKGAEYGGLVGGAIALSSGNVAAAAVGGMIAFVGYLIDRR